MQTTLTSINQAVVFVRTPIEIFCLLGSLLFSEAALAQEYNRGLFKPIDGLFGNRCAEYTTTLARLPYQLGYGIDIEDRNIYLSYSSLEAFKKIYNQPGDGIALEIFQFSQFGCDQPEEAGRQGYLLPPLDRKDLKKRLLKNELNEVMFLYGRLPEQFDPMDVECKLWVIQKKAVCADIILVDIEQERWDLLDMGLYYDSTGLDKAGLSPKMRTREINLELLFEKDEATFSSEVVQPIYDSLQLEEYVIQEIWVEAYTSIEGSFEHNQALQKRRIDALLQAFQQYQQQEIELHYRSRENWPAFARDIGGSAFEGLKKLSKTAVKELLASDNGLLQKLEPLLKQHRLGKVRLLVTKNSSAEKISGEELATFFNQAIGREDVATARALQHYIIGLVQDKKRPDSLLNDLEIPPISLYGPLFNNLFIARTNIKKQNASLSLQKIKELRVLIPTSKELLYNELVLTIRAWSEGNQDLLNQEVFSRQLRELSDAKFSERLLNRLKVNFYIIKAQYHYLDKDFKGRERAIRTVYATYKHLTLTDEDAIRLGRFLAQHQELKLARALVRAHLQKTPQHTEPLLFYYLTLVTTDRQLMGKQETWDLFEEASHMNQERFCKLFLPIPRGGHSMQLLKLPEMKEIYCASCAGELTLVDE